MTVQLTRRPHTRSFADATPLRRLCGGDVHLPGDPGYDAARLPWSAAVDQRPAAVVFPRSATDVSEVVRAAAGLGLRVAPQSTGHNAGPLAAQGLEDVVIVRTSGLDEVTVDLERQVVVLPSGRESAFEIDAGIRERLLNGWDDIDLTLRREDEIAAYERERERPGDSTLTIARARRARLPGL